MTSRIAEREELGYSDK
ncbi:hypothetical protein A2U01_0103623, partial [Trifolium medium]|nr:hypothetical protein [Trifolium medium]